MDILIGKRLIGPSHPPMIVAEFSGNHHGSLDKMLKMVDVAKEMGVDAIKLQTYTPDTITLDLEEGDFVIHDPKSLWTGRSLYHLYLEAYTPWEWHQPIFEKCKKLGILAFSTPFDETAVDFLEAFDPPCYKIASLEIVDLPLIHKIASTRKPLIMSIGGASLTEISEAVDTARKAGCKDLILLQCTLGYPTPPSECNLNMIPHLSSTFNTLVGLSDHTLSLAVPIASIALGACLIEKHFTLSRDDGDIDGAFSLNPKEFQTLVNEAKTAWEALGSVQYSVKKSEATTISHRPSLYFITDLPSGTIVREDHIKSLRPGTGLAPKELPHLLGLSLTTSVKKGTPVSWKLFTN